jgi:predicted ArsR family transcriptional regulator
VCIDALVTALQSMGFDPASEVDEAAATVVFTHCPFRELAEAHPEVVCHLHRGIVEGFLERSPVDVEEFGTLADRAPCQVVLTRR